MVHASGLRSAALVVSLAAVGQALNGIVAPSTVAANKEFQVTFEGGSSDQYRVYLAAALAGVNGPTCYLKNSTSLSSPVALTIPASVGPSAGYYSIAVSDLTSSQGATYSNRFNLTGANATYTPYETHLGGAPFWSADDLPCSSYECARQCAQAGYPDDLTDTSAYATMKQCILQCSGVTPAASITGPAHGTATGSMQATTLTANEALVTLGPGLVMTALETTATSDGSTLTEAILGSQTLTQGGSAATISGKAVSLAKTGIEVDSTNTAAFKTATVTTSVQATAASASASASTTDSGAGSRQESVMGGALGVAGLAMLLL